MLTRVCTTHLADINKKEATRSYNAVNNTPEFRVLKSFYCFLEQRAKKKKIKKSLFIFHTYLPTYVWRTKGIKKKKTGSYSNFYIFVAIPKTVVDLARKKNYKYKKIIITTRAGCEKQSRLSNGRDLSQPTPLSTDRPLANRKRTFICTAYSVLKMLFESYKMLFSRRHL